MKHFFDQSTKLDSAAKAELLRSARAALKRSPMMVSDMVTKMNLLSFNASGANHYVPRGMENFISVKNIALSQSISDKIGNDIDEAITSSAGDVVGFVLENISVKEIHNYFDILFKLNKNFQFDPITITHFSYDEMIGYLQSFLKASHVDGKSRKIEVFDERNPKPWKTLSGPRELDKVDKTIKAPIIIDRPFFNDVHLNVVKNEKNQVLETSFGQIKSVQPYFNRYQAPSGELLRSNNKLFIKWQELNKFKLATAQAKNLMGITYKGEYIAAAQFITHQIGLQLIDPKFVDCFHFILGREPIEVKPEEIASFELNLDTQQIIVTRKIGDSEFHAARFNRLKLHREDESRTIDNVVPFNRGASNYDQIQKLVATRYTEYEKARSIFSDRGEFGLLGSRNVTSGDLVSHLVLSSMKLFNYITFDTHCIGFEPKDIRNQKHFNERVIELNKELSGLFKDILDVSETPSLSDHNINRLTKNAQAYLKLKDRSRATYDLLENIIQELEELTQYMDDFFKLNVYADLEENLECETIPDDESEMLDSAAIDEKNTRLDADAKSFISENFTFFRKRGLVQSALIKTERLLFYQKQIKPFAEDLKFEPDIIVYNDGKKKMDNYAYSSYPAMDISRIISKDLISFDDDEKELSFVRFMRGFTEKTYQKSLELNKSFHHQYKHTLAELGFIADEKLSQLSQELEFLEKPENREKTYQQLLEKMTLLFNEHLQNKQNNIQDLEKELQDIQLKKSEFQKSFGSLLEMEISDDELEPLLQSMPDRLESLRAEIIKSHKIKLTDTSVVLNAYAKMHASANRYFSKILSSFNQFLKALWIRRYQRMFEAVKKQSILLFNLQPDALQAKIQKLESFQYDNNKTSSIQNEMMEISQKMKSMLVDLRAIPLKGLFGDKLKEKGNLLEYLTYYQSETEKLNSLIRSIQPVYQQLSNLQNQLFKKQEEYVAAKLKKNQNELQIQLAKNVLDNPGNKAEIEDLEPPADEVPKEIREELSSLRAELVATVKSFKASTLEQTLVKVADYSELIERANARDKINDISKELVNYTQGIQGLQFEIEGEKKDLETMKTQEDNLEEIAMSKALPSTRILLKTQYIPLLKKEKELLVLANKFLTEIISKQDEITKALVATFFKKRYGLQQFTNGSYCLDMSVGTKDHTEKNVYGAYGLFSERFNQAAAEAATVVETVKFAKVQVNGVESLKNRISQIWHDKLDDRFLYLPSSLTLREALELCEYKEMVSKNNPKSLKSKHSLILIYAHSFDYDEIQSDKILLQNYNEAILSNILINIDGEYIYNNRESIFDAFVKETFGNCDDLLSGNIMQKLLGNN
jgi:hypothetical protein